MDHYEGTGTSGASTKSRTELASRTTIVRTGHPALDAALASDRSARADLRVLQAGCRATKRDATAVPASGNDSRAAVAGSVVDAMSLTADRDGAGTTLHAGSTHKIVDTTGRGRTIRVWHELSTHGSN